MKMRKLTMAAAVWAVCFAVMLAGCAKGPTPVIRPRQPDDEGEAVIVETVTMDTTELLGEPDEEELPAEPPEGAEGDPIPTIDDIDDMPYLIEAGDQLEFRSFDDPNLSQALVVRYDGHISLPMVPDIKVQKLTRQEATEKVREAYTEIFKDPQLSLAITATTSKTFHVMGDVEKPQEFPYTKPISVLDAINQAGGPRVNQRRGDSFIGARGTLTQALIIRRYGGERDVIQCDLSQFREPEVSPADTLVLPEDIVYVPEGVNLVYVFGEVRAPDVYQLLEGTTLLELLTRAAGVSETTARLRRVVLIREVDETRSQVYLVNVREILKTGRDLEMQPGDILYIPRKPLIRLQEFVGRFTGSITPLLGLYRQAYDTYYTDRRYDALFDEGANTSAEILTVLQSIRDFGSLATSIPTP